MSGFIGFMNGPLGRGARILAGAALVYCGLAVLGGTTGYIVAAAGVVPIVMGASGKCLLEFAGFKA